MPWNRPQVHAPLPSFHEMQEDNDDFGEEVYIELSEGEDVKILLT